MSKLHILTNPNSPVNLNNRTDPFAVAAYKFIDNMTKLGWTCIHYGIKGCNVPCETVICLQDLISPTVNSKVYHLKASEEIQKRKSPKDIILCFHGWENKVATDAHQDLIVIEPSIGYDVKAVFAPYRVFVSYPHMHMYYGHKDMLINPSWFDAVIPNAFTPKEFEFSDQKKDYFLYFGRIIESKGLNIVIQATEAAGVKVVIAGPGDLKHLGYSKIPSHVTFVGVCDAVKRKELMRDARAILGPTYYVEPFGNMVVEGYFSGTPAITTDWGGFVDTVIPNKTGFRCREFKEFVHAIKNIDSINPHDCRAWAMENYSEEIVHKRFDQYFKKILDGDFYRK